MISAMNNFYGFCDECEQNNERLQNGMEIEMGRREEIISTYGNDAKEWQEAGVMYDQLKEDLAMHIGLSICYEGLRDKLGNEKQIRNGHIILEI